jgi:N-acetylglutamate synthase
MPDPHVEDLERAAARHWQAPDAEPLGEWSLRAAAGFTGRANSALPLGDPGRPLPDAVAAVEEWYRRRDLRPMIVLPQGAGPARLEDHLTERGRLPRPGPAFVMLAGTRSLPASQAEVEFAPESDAAFLGLYRYRGQDLPPIARTLCFPARLRAPLSRLLPSSAAPFGSRVIRHRFPLNPARRSTCGAASRTRTVTST